MSGAKAEKGDWRRTITFLTLIANLDMDLQERGGGQIQLILDISIE
jgi:hypothetical protein